MLNLGKLGQIIK